MRSPFFALGNRYAQVSPVLEAAPDTLIGNGTALASLAWLEDRLELLRSRGW
jgi:hypothetical protein